MAESNDLVEIAELHFSYGEMPIFRSLSLKIPRGKLVAILGGSGKSTLLTLIGAQLAPHRGWVRVYGKLVHKLGTDDLYALRRKMGMMFQSSGLFTDLFTAKPDPLPLSSPRAAAGHIAIMPIVRLPERTCPPGAVCAAPQRRTAPGLIFLL